MNPPTPHRDVQHTVTALLRMRQADALAVLSAEAIRRWARPGPATQARIYHAAGHRLTKPGQTIQGWALENFRTRGVPHA